MLESLSGELGFGTSDGLKCRDHFFGGYMKCRLGDNQRRDRGDPVSFGASQVD
jgi:hypothetical protein